MIGGLGAPPYTCKVIYLDNNATTMPLAEVVDAMRESLVSNWGNPSSVHRFGQAARAQLEQAREHVAQLAGCTEREIIFCSSGTESAALALRGVLQAHATRRLIVTSKLEHAAVRNLVQHLEDAGTCEVIWVEHAPSGEIQFDHLRSVVQKRANEIALVSLMSVNNETGVTLAVREVGELCRKSGVLFHSDVTQSVGRENFDVVNSMVDFATFSAHKLHGPKGAAALFARRGAGIVAQLVGGPQERDRRAGTENVAGLIGFGVAAQASRAWLSSANAKHSAELRNQLETLILNTIPQRGYGTQPISHSRIWRRRRFCWRFPMRAFAPARARRAVRVRLILRQCCWQWASHPCWPMEACASVCHASQHKKKLRGPPQLCAIAFANFARALARR